MSGDPSVKTKNVPFKILKAATLLVFLGVVGYGFWRGIAHSDLLKVQNIVIEGASKTTEARIREHLDVKTGDPFWRIPVEKEAAVIKQDGWVESVELRRRFPGTIVVNVTERKPIAVTSNLKGRFEYVDENNNVIDRAQPDQISDYPVLAGAEFENDRDLRGQALALLKSLPDDGDLSKNEISEIQFHDEHGFQMTLSKTRTVIDLGRENIPLHLDRARRVVQYLQQHNINASHVDSDYAKKVLVKVRKDR
jgi:cell division septal protein FtsQ